KVEAAMGRVREALKTNRKDEIKSATEALTTVWHEAASKMYQQSGASSTGQDQGPKAQAEHREGKSAEGGSASGGKTEKDSTVDADYEVVG
ncbi:MAG: molecular chaperone DnaK, partial [Candidatus Zixiibacteriota bacterium]